MAKQVKIKDIAKMAGVSAGTVDRVLHNRGKVSAKSKEKVERVLQEVDYKMNIHASAISFRKEFTIVIVIPTYSPGEYWGAIRNGIEAALNEYADINIRSVWFPYNQFDIYSCRTTFDSVFAQHPDAVVVGPTFEHETQVFCQRLDDENIPYVFIDAAVTGTNPWATFTTDQNAAGRLMARLLSAVIPSDAQMAVLTAQRIGTDRASNSLEREQGFRDYLSSAGKADRVHFLKFDPLLPEDSARRIEAFLQEHPRVKGMAVMNSRGHIAAEAVRDAGIRDITLICFDMTTGNVRYLQEGNISILLCQSPEKQGFNAIKSLIGCLLYRQPEKEPHHLMPIDIILAENLPFYQQ